MRVQDEDGSGEIEFRTIYRVQVFCAWQSDDRAHECVAVCRHDDGVPMSKKDFIDKLKAEGWELVNGLWVCSAHGDERRRKTFPVRKVKQ